MGSVADKITIIVFLPSYKRIRRSRLEVKGQWPRISNRSNWQRLTSSGRSKWPKAVQRGVASVGFEVKGANAAQATLTPVDWYKVRNRYIMLRTS